MVGHRSRSSQPLWSIPLHVKAEKQYTTTNHTRLAIRLQACTRSPAVIYLKNPKAAHIAKCLPEGRKLQNGTASRNHAMHIQLCIIICICNLPQKLCSIKDCQSPKPTCTSIHMRKEIQKDVQPVQYRNSGGPPRFGLNSCLRERSGLPGRITPPLRRRTVRTGPAASYAMESLNKRISSCASHAGNLSSYFGRTSQGKSDSLVGAGTAQVFRIRH